MRKTFTKIFFVLALGAVLCASLSSFSYAFAAQNSDTYYPDTFEFELELVEVADYAIEDDRYIFAASDGVTAIAGKDMKKSNLSAASVDIENGVFYCSIGEVTFRSFDGETWSTCEDRSFDEPLQTTPLMDGIVYNSTENGISIYDTATDTLDRDTLEGFRLMKQYGEKLYAICGDCLYEIDGYNTVPVEIAYIDYSEAENVFTGDTSLSSWSEALENPSDLSLDVGTIEEGAFVSEINLASISDEFFEVLDTFEVTETSSPKAGDEVLILCRSGNACVVATGLKAYVVKTVDIEENDESVKISSADETGTVNMSGFCSYLIPILNDAAKKDDLYSDEQVTICGKLSASEMSFLYCDFYLVSYETDEGESFGFVPSPYISADGFTDGEYRIVEDENASSDSYVLTVVLILIVIALVLLAIGYIVFVATRPKKKKKAAGNGEDEDDE